MDNNVSAISKALIQTILCPNHFNDPRFEDKFKVQLNRKKVLPTLDRRQCQKTLQESIVHVLSTYCFTQSHNPSTFVPPKWSFPTKPPLILRFGVRDALWEK